VVRAQDCIRRGQRTLRLALAVSEAGWILSLATMTMEEATDSGILNDATWSKVAAYGWISERCPIAR
jgi:hypothetical protein